MKKKHLTAFRLGFISLAITIIGICFYSCQNSVDEPQTQIEQQETLAFQQLQQDLESYTDEFLASHPQSDSRGFWSWITKIVLKAVCKVVATDTYHFFDNLFSGRNVFEGVGAASANAFSLDKDLPKNFDYIKLNLIQRQSIDSLYEYYENSSQSQLGKGNIKYGILHNYAILNQIKSSEFDNSSILQKTTIQTQCIENLKNPAIKLSTSQKQAEYITLFMENIYSDNLTQYQNNLTSRHPNHIEELTIINSYIETIEEFSSLDSFREFSIGYCATIRQSALTQQQKNNLIKLLELASESTALWTTLVEINPPALDSPVQE